MACIGHTAATHQAVEESGVFALNILPSSARDLAARFASQDDDKFEGVETEIFETGAPLLRIAVAFCDCRVERSVPAGDHTIFIGRVLASGAAGDARQPLLYHRGGYRTIGDPRASGAPTHDG